MSEHQAATLVTVLYDPGVLPKPDQRTAIRLWLLSIPEGEVKRA